MRVKITSSKRHTTDKTKVALAVRARLIPVFQGAVRAFIEEAVKHVVIDTGMSAASFIPLAATVNFNGFQINSKRERKGWTDINRVYHPGETKGIQRGITLGKSAYKFKLPGILHNRQPKYLFEFNIVIFQYIIHESSNNIYGIKSSDWRSLTFAKLAFFRYWVDNLPDEAEIIGFLREG